LRHDRVTSRRRIERNHPASSGRAAHARRSLVENATLTMPNTPPRSEKPPVSQLGMKKQTRYKPCFVGVAEPGRDTAMNGGSLHDDTHQQHQTLVTLRWVLIVATGYLLLYFHPVGSRLPVVGAFLAAYLASNFVFAALLRRVKRPRLLEMAVVLFDSAAVSAALLLAQSGSSDFFLLYFFVLFLATLSERVELVATAAALGGALHLYTTATLYGTSVLANGELVRIPFLFVVALFFGHLVARARSAEREAEEAIRREAMLADLVADVVGDFKMPLGGIRAMAEIALESRTGSLNPEQMELLRRIEANARHMTKMASNLVDAGRFEVGKLEIRRERASLLDVVLGALRVARSVGEFKGVSVDLDVVSMPPDVLMDVVHMDRVIWSLLDNAIRNSPAGGEVIVSLDHRGSQVVLSVSDDGQGIPTDDLPILFDRYQRGRRRDSRNPGLGLFIAKRIVDAHGGTIDVDTEPNGGTTFTVNLQVPEPPDLKRNGDSAGCALVEP
jgi:signal transduction histidine kinase